MTVNNFKKVLINFFYQALVTLIIIRLNNYVYEKNSMWDKINIRTQVRIKPLLLRFKGRLSTRTH